MIGREKRVLLRHYLEQGMNKAVIARDLGVSRRTVYHWIETGQLDWELDAPSAFAEGSVNGCGSRPEKLSQP